MLIKILVYIPLNTEKHLTIKININAIQVRFNLVSLV